MFSPDDIIEGKYRVVRHIGSGGMGAVYEGVNVRIGRRVAIKVLHAQVAEMPEFVERFEREAQAAARIGSPHVCDVLDLGDLENGDRFIVMEYLEGASLEERLEAKDSLTAQELAPIAFELLEGLATMHAAGVVHRDLKPANVFLAKSPGGRGEIVKILDFGVAKVQPLGGQLGTMTQTGAMMGTPLYMSPEQARGARDVDARTDVYAASVIFYRALAGILPYKADTLNELLFKIVLEDPKPLVEIVPDVDATFAAIVHRGLNRDVEQRIPNAREYQSLIAAWGKSQGRQSLAFATTMASDRPAPAAKPISSSGSRPLASAEILEVERSTKSPVQISAAPRTAVSGVPATAVSNDLARIAIQAPSPVDPSSPNSGTPIVWSDDDPPKNRSLSLEPSGPTLTSRVSHESTSAGVASTHGPAQAPAKKRPIMLGAIGAAVVAIAAIVVVTRGGDKTSSTSAATSSALPAPSNPSPNAVPADSAPTAAPPPAETKIVDLALAAPDAAPAPPAVAATAKEPSPTKREGVAKQTRPAGTEATTAAGMAATPSATAAPTSSAHGRKYRTNID
ncbi:serine/threonine protein kinase [Labilithrix luteola]|uniref:Serine/threonine protein kinase n=1 Tax=Labilithrix luteola TaxID=1391654 RepID=A0A0K1PUY8_9BACT|nr:serine/threonine-protein kinase [Labilithrix luteola]AKU97191.1 serine/threonine protein kinase [Labilithrix luteola]